MASGPCVSVFYIHTYIHVQNECKHGCLGVTEVLQGSRQAVVKYWSGWSCPFAFWGRSPHTCSVHIPALDAPQDCVCTLYTHFRLTNLCVPLMPYNSCLLVDSGPIVHSFVAVHITHWHVSYLLYTTVTCYPHTLLCGMPCFGQPHVEVKVIVAVLCVTAKGSCRV